MSYVDYFRAVRKYWWIVLISFILGAGVGAYVTLTTQKLYATKITFFVQTPSDQLSVAAQGDAFGQKRVNSYVQLATTDRLMKPVLADTKIPLSVGQLASEVQATADQNTVLLTVIVTDPEPSRSIEIAKSISTQFVKVVSDLEATSSGDSSSVQLELVSGPTFNPTPVQPRPILNYGFAIIAGLAIGCGIAIYKQVSDRSIRNSAMLERTTAAPTVGSIVFDETAASNPLIVDGPQKSIRAEAFRQLRTNLEFIDVDKPVQTLVITSSVPNEGKSSTATNLAVIFAEAGKKVLLIEGDLRRPRVAEYLGLEGSIGLTNVLAGQAELTEVLQTWGRGGLTVLPSGSIPPNPSELLGSRSMTDMLASMTDLFDVILIDSPPLLPVTDAAVLAAHADGAILVVRYGTTTKAQVAIAAGALKHVGARLLGSVLNMAPAAGVDGYGYGYEYAYADSLPEGRTPLMNSAHLVNDEPGRHSDPASVERALQGPSSGVIPSATTTMTKMDYN